MRNSAFHAALHAVRQVFKIAAALFAKGIQRAVAEETVKILSHALVTGEILTFGIGKMLIAVGMTHVFILLQKIRGMLCKKVRLGYRLFYNLVTARECSVEQ